MRLAVALHDVEPATYEKCALIRDWLGDLGVDRVTLLVVPASDRHPFDRRDAELAAWLAERREHGDAIAQQGCGGAPDAIGDPPAAGATSLRRLAAPWRGRRPATAVGELLRLDIHPGDLARRSRVAACERVLTRAGDRRTVTYDAV